MNAVTSRPSTATESSPSTRPLLNFDQAVSSLGVELIWEPAPVAAGLPDMLLVQSTPDDITTPDDRPARRQPDLRLYKRKERTTLSLLKDPA